MSTIKSDTLQPTLSGNNLVIRTGVGDVERLRITPTGAMSVAGSVSTVFSGGVSFSAPINVNGKAGIGSAYSGTPVVDLDVVSGANASLLDPQLNTYTTTQGRAVAAFRTSATNTTLFFGNSGVSAAWLQVQNSDNTQRSLALNPIGGNVGIGTTGPTTTLDVNGTIKTNTAVTVGSASMTAPSGSAPLFGIRAWGSFRGSTTSPYPVTGVCGGNVSSITKLATTGEYGITFGVAMPHNNYAVVFGGSNANDGSGLATIGTDSPWNVGNRTVNGFKIRVSDTGGTVFNLGQNGRIHEIFFMVLA